jgi:hypothetical protein
MPDEPAFLRRIDRLGKESLGLTKREWFAGMALMGFAANPETVAWSNQTAAKAAVMNADALIAALKETDI